MAINVNPGAPLRLISSYNSSGNFTVPLGTSVAFVSIHSSTGGGGGVQGPGGRYGGPGNARTGGTGIVAGAWVQVAPGSTYPVVVGAGGSPGFSTNTGGAATSGAVGGTSTFDGGAFVVTGSNGGGVNGGSDGSAGSGSGATALSSLSPSANALVKTATITTQATGAFTGGNGGNGNRYSQTQGTGNAGTGAAIYVYI